MSEWPPQRRFDIYRQIDRIDQNRWKPWLDLITGLAMVVFASLWVVGLIDRVVMPLIAFTGVEVQVSDLRGLPAMQAQAECKRLGLEFIRGRVRVDNAHAPGTVIDQFPPVGSNVKPGRRIEVTVCVSDAAVSCPDVTGKSPREASLIADSTGLMVYLDSIKYKHSGSYPAGVVLKQNPAALSQMKRGDELKLWVSLGGEQQKALTAPDIVGKTLDEAEILLAQANLSLGNVKHIPQRNIQEGLVLAQSPAPGAAIQPGELINVRVAVRQTVTEDASPEPVKNAAPESIPEPANTPSTP